MSARASRSSKAPSSSSVKAPSTRTSRASAKAPSEVAEDVEDIPEVVEDADDEEVTVTRASRSSVKAPSAKVSVSSVKAPSAKTSVSSVKAPSARASRTSVKAPSEIAEEVEEAAEAEEEDVLNTPVVSAKASATSVKAPSARASASSVKAPSARASRTSVKAPSEVAEIADVEDVEVAEEPVPSPRVSRSSVAAPASAKASRSSVKAPSARASRRSSSRSRAASRSSVAAPAEPAAPAKKASQAAAPAPAPMFEEGDEVMSKWPGTALFFKSKVTYVREEDNEYDVQFENGTIYTLKARDVKKNVVATAKTPKPRSRSRSRGRSPAASPAVKKGTGKRKSAAFTAPKPDAVTPTRQSARIAARLEAVTDDDETHGPKATPNPSHAVAKKGGILGFFRNLSFEWLTSLILMALCPLILISLHTLCTKSSCKPVLPFEKLPKKLDAYWDPKAFLTVVAFTFVLRLLAMLLPIGSIVKTSTGHDVRMNGFYTLIALMGVVPVLIYKKVDLSIVRVKYFHLMTSSLLLAFIMALIARLAAQFLTGRNTNVNPKGNTGNFIVDFFNGREFNPNILGLDLKLQTFRFSMIGLAAINVCLVIDNILSRGGAVNHLVTLASAFQVLYALDSMFFEEYYFFSHDAMNTGYGFSLVSSYNSFPFLPTLITKYLIDRQPTMEWYYLVAIGVLNAIGYIIFRASETQRCEFAKDPNSDSMKQLESLPTAGGRKLLISGWWGMVRHPNYLGEILIQWSWVLPAVTTAGRVDLLVYYLPIFTTLVLLMRCRQQNARNRKKYGLAWETYCEKVPSNLIPKIY